MRAKQEAARGSRCRPTATTLAGAASGHPNNDRTTQEDRSRALGRWSMRYATHGDGADQVKAPPSKCTQVEPGEGGPSFERSFESQRRLFGKRKGPEAEHPTRILFSTPQGSAALRNLQGLTRSIDDTTHRRAALPSGWAKRRRSTEAAATPLSRRAPRRLRTGHQPSRRHTIRSRRSTRSTRPWWSRASRWPW